VLEAPRHYSAEAVGYPPGPPPDFFAAFFVAFLAAFLAGAFFTAFLTAFLEAFFDAMAFLSVLTARSQQQRSGIARVIHYEGGCGVKKNFSTTVMSSVRA
jgi:hypothetical protein